MAQLAAMATLLTLDVIGDVTIFFRLWISASARSVALKKACQNVQSHDWVRYVRTFVLGNFRIGGRYLDSSRGFRLGF